MKPVNICIIKRITSDIPYVFEDVALCVKEQLEQAGLITILTVNKIIPDALNIIFGAGAPGGPTICDLRSLASPNNTIIFNLEQLGAGGPWDNIDYFNLLSDFPVYDYNHQNVIFMRRRSSIYHGIEFPIYPSQNFREEPKTIQPNLPYDACFYGSLNLRREAILNSRCCKTPGTRMNPRFLG
jgi:hypothetical protein